MLIDAVSCWSIAGLVSPTSMMLAVIITLVCFKLVNDM